MVERVERGERERVREREVKGGRGREGRVRRKDERL
jgi:hypothetical protein